MKLFLILAALAPALLFAEPAHTAIDRSGHTHYLGLKRDPKSLEEFKKRAHKFLLTRSTAPVPGKYDLSPRVSLPENQGNCGSCWAFALTKALRSALMLTGKDPGVLAFNYLVNNCGPVSESGCNGGDFNAGENFLNGLGPWLESADPYTQSDGGKCLGLAPAGTALAYPNVVGPGNRPATFQELATAISQNHMLVVDVAVCGAWQSYSGGIFSKSQCGARSINHMINMNGYDCETSVDSQGNCVFDSKGQPVNGDGYLIAMNNWGENDGWGEVNPSNGHGGYMRTRWGVDAIADTAMYFEVAQPAPPPPPPGPAPAPTCTLQVSAPADGNAYPGGKVTIAYSSTGAQTMTVNGTATPSTSGSVDLTAPDAPGFVSVTGAVTAQDGQTGACATQYTVLPAPDPGPTPPPTPSDASIPWWVWIVSVAGVGLIIWRIVRAKAKEPK